MESVDKAPVDAESLRDSGMKVAAQVFFRLVRGRPEELKVRLPLAVLLAQCEKNDFRGGRSRTRRMRSGRRRCSLRGCGFNMMRLMRG